MNKVYSFETAKIGDRVKVLVAGHDLSNACGTITKIGRVNVTMTCDTVRLPNGHAFSNGKFAFRKDTGHAAPGLNQMMHLIPEADWDQATYLASKGATYRKEHKMIDTTKPLMTRDGRPVRIFATDGGYPGPILGAVKIVTAGKKYATSWEAARWWADGVYFEDGRHSDWDLVPFKTAKVEAHKANIAKAHAAWLKDRRK